MKLQAVLVLMATALVLGQRPFFAGSRPIGYPEMATSAPAGDDLGNRFGEGDNSSTTQRLPIEAQGDRDLVNRLSKLPIDKQPFWLINWQALEANRKKPQTYPQRPSSFADTFNTGSVDSNSELGNRNRVSPKPVVTTSNANVNTVGSANINSPLVNSNGANSTPRPETSIPGNLNSANINERLNSTNGISVLGDRNGGDLTSVYVNSVDKNSSPSTNTNRKENSPNLNSNKAGPSQGSVIGNVKPAFDKKPFDGNSVSHHVYHTSSPSHHHHNKPVHSHHTEYYDYGPFFDDTDDSDEFGPEFKHAKHSDEIYQGHQ